MFYNRYLSLCRMRGVTPSGGADEMNVNRATVTFWKKDGFSPRQSTLEKLSCYFGVPISFLMGESLSPCPLCGGSGLSHSERHQKWEEAAARFGFCWNLTLRQKALTLAAERLSPTLPAKEQISLVTDLIKTHFSYSLELCGYDLGHTAFQDYRRALLAHLPWEDYLSHAVLHYLQELPVSAAPPATPLYILPKTLFTPPAPPKKAVEVPSPTRLRLRDSAVSKPLRFTGVIPVLGRIDAGSPVIADEHVEEYIPTALPHPEEYFALRVRGDSMTGAGINDGDTVLIHRQETARHGQIVACLVNGEEATLKRFTVSDSTVLLLPENSKYQPIVVRPGDFENGKAKILGVATEVTHHLI